jgi:hypothetical protein
MPITRTPMIDDDGSGTTGTIINNAWKQEFYNQIDALIGPWVAVPFSAADFTASAGAWTVSAGNIQNNRYTQIGQTVIWSLSITGSSLTATPAELYIRMPSGFVMRPFTGGATGQLSDGTERRGSMFSNSSGQTLIVQQNPYGPFTTNSGATTVMLTAILERTS